MTETATAKKATKQRSYFAEDTLNRYYLDDEESYIEHKKLDEGSYQKYQDLTSKIKLSREDDSTEVDMAIGRQRRFLLETLVEGWNLVDAAGKPVRFSTEKLFQLPPDISAGLLEDIQKANPILSRGDEDETDSEGKS